jgi:hypothetical protein
MISITRILKEMDALLAPGTPGKIAKEEPNRKGATDLGRNPFI